MPHSFVGLLRAGAVATTVFASIGPAIADDPPPARSCAIASQVNNFKGIDDYSAIIEVSANRRFKVTFFNSCREMRWALFMHADLRSGTCLTKGDRLTVGRHGSSELCTIQTIEPLPPADRATRDAR